MDGQFHIDVSQVVSVADALAAAPDIAHEELIRATWESEFLLQREVQELTPVGIGAGGGLKGSIAAQEPEILSDGVIGAVGTSLAHAVPVELGTKPHRPPVDPLIDWARHKLGVSPQEAQSVGWAIAKKIAVEGTEGAHMFERGFQAAEPQVHDIYKRAAARIAQRIGGRA